MQNKIVMSKKQDKQVIVVCAQSKAIGILGWVTYFCGNGSVAEVYKNFHLKMLCIITYPSSICLSQNSELKSSRLSLAKCKILV